MMRLQMQFSKEGIAQAAKADDEVATNARQAADDAEELALEAETQAADINLEEQAQEATDLEAAAVSKEGIELKQPYKLRLQR